MGVGLALGSGLIPSLKVANSKVLSNVRVRRDFASEEEQQELGPPLPCAPLLLLRSPPKLAATVAVVARLDPDLMQGKKLIQQVQFEETLKKTPPRKWPVDAEGQAVGGDVLAAAAASTWQTRPLSPLALEVVWIALSGGSSFLAAEEYQRQCERWRPDQHTFVLSLFERALLQGRATTFLGYGILLGLQAAVLLVLVIQPLADQLAARQ